METQIHKEEMINPQKEKRKKSEFLVRVKLRGRSSKKLRGFQSFLFCLIFRKRPEGFLSTVLHESNHWVLV
jgi:hypothetical protein